MRMTRVALGAVGIATVPLNNRLYTGAFTANLFGDTAISSVSAQVDGCDIDTDVAPVRCTVTSSTTTATITFPATAPHRLGAVTDYILVTGTGTTNLDGVYQVASISSATVLTYTVVSGTHASPIQCFAVPIKFIATAIATGTVSKTAATSKVATSTLYNTLVFNVTAWTGGVALLDVHQPGTENS